MIEGRRLPKVLRVAGLAVAKEAVVGIVFNVTELAIIACPSEHPVLKVTLIATKLQVHTG